ncbi:hypothetical protein DP939_11125 [Spongiactinospora rosea]|uniref:Septum formation initiator n=1 Tax=Spongiactinospora rosea TaxID=2248750 RepID=A0A366M3J7_9ACTN|nr:hypothetical protein DP939_11125 [Spongiactinospora rosea]
MLGKAGPVRDLLSGGAPSKSAWRTGETRRLPRPARAATAAPARRGRAPRAPFVLLLVGLLCGGLVTLLLLNTVLAQDSFEADELRHGVARIQREAERQKLDNARQDTAEALAERAGKLGARPDPSARVIEIGKGAPVGAETGDAGR